MNAFPYLFPLLTCILIYVSKGTSTNVWTYIWVILIVWSITKLIHFCFKKYQESATEYLGSYVTDLFHEDSWVEIRIEKKRVKVGTDRNGNDIYRDVEEIRHINHPDEWYMHTSIGSRIVINYSTYNYIQILWGTKEYCSSITGKHIVGGVRCCRQCHFLDVTNSFFIGQSELSPFSNPDYAERFFTITECHTYTNKIRHSHSIFRYEKISKDEKEEYGLYDYPEIIDNDQECILGKEFPAHVHRAFRLFNSYFGAKYQIRVFILLFDANKGITVSEKQRAYWNGGNKNELVVCLGIDDVDRVKWCHSFSWMDEPVMTVKIEGYFREHEKLDLMVFNFWLRMNIEYWQRKEFEDFNYIDVSLSSVQYWIWVALSLFTNSIAIWIVLN